MRRRDKQGFEVYLITNKVNGKTYVGKTVCGTENRWLEHLYNAKRGKFPIYNAIRKYGKESFTVTTVYEGISEREINAVEKGLIAQLGTYAPNGYNITSGGDGVAGLKFSAETRRKMSESRKGKPSGTKGIKWPEDRKKAHAPHIRKIADSISCPVYCVETGETWPNMAACVKSFGVCASTQLKRCLNSERRTYKGLHFRDVEGARLPQSPRTTMYSPVMCIETGRTWQSQSDCMMDLCGQKATSHLYKCIDKPHRTYKGMHFVSLKHRPRIDVKEAA